MGKKKVNNLHQDNLTEISNRHSSKSAEYIPIATNERVSSRKNRQQYDNEVYFIKGEGLIIFGREQFKNWWGQTKSRSKFIGVPGSTLVKAINQHEPMESLRIRLMSEDPGVHIIDLSPDAKKPISINGLPHHTIVRLSNIGDLLALRSDRENRRGVHQKRELLPPPILSIISKKKIKEAVQSTIAEFATAHKC